MANRGLLAIVASLGLWAGACADTAGESEVRAVDANTGQLLWTKRTDAEFSQLFGVGCASGADPLAPCRDDVAVIETSDNCDDRKSLAVDPHRGRQVETPNEARVALMGDQRLEPVWRQGASMCRQIGEADPYFAAIAPLVGGVCLLHCVGPKDRTPSAGCTLAGVDAATKQELWRIEVGAFNNVTVRGAFLLVVRDNEEATTGAGSYALSRIDVRSGSELWSLPNAERLSWAGMHADQVLLASSDRLMSVGADDGHVWLDVPSSGAAAGAVAHVAFFTRTLRRSECPTPD